MIGIFVRWIRRNVACANCTFQHGFDRSVENTEVDVVEVEFGQKMNWHTVGHYPKVVQRVHFDVTWEDQSLVVPFDNSQVFRLVRQPGVPASHAVPVDQIEVQYSVVAHVVRGDVTAGASGRQHDEVVINFFGREIWITQEFCGHCEFSVAGQRVEEQHSETVFGDW